MKSRAESNINLVTGKFINNVPSDATAAQNYDANYGKIDWSAKQDAPKDERRDEQAGREK